MTRDAAPGGMPRRLAWRSWQVVRTSWPTAAWSGAAGLLLQLLFPVSAHWLPALAAAAFAVIALACFVAGDFASGAGGDEAASGGLGRLDRAALLERSNTAQQFGHAFGTAALILAALSLGLWVGLLGEL